MNFIKAFAVFMQIDSKEFTEDEKYEAIQQVLDAATINSITKKQVLNVVSWLFDKQQKYRWHDLRKNTDDLPEDNKQVLVSIKDGCIHRTWHDSHGWRNRNSKIRYYSDKSVLAWREIGDVCMGVKNEHYYLVVKSEKEKKQIVDLTENEIIRDAGYMRFIPATAELNIEDVE